MKITVENSIKYVGCSIFLAYLLILPVLKLNNLHGHYWDIIANVKRIFLFANEPMYVFDGHFTPILYVIELITRPFDKSEAVYLLELLNALVLVYSVFLIRNLFSGLLAIYFIISVSFWSILEVGFHFDVFIIPLSVYFFYFYENRNIARATLVACCFCLVKEVYALYTIAGGLIILIDATRARKWDLLKFGLTCKIFGILWFFLSIFFINTYSPTSVDDFGINSDAFAWLGDGIVNKIAFLFFNPHEIIERALYDFGLLKHFFILFTPFFLSLVYNYVVLVFLSPFILVGVLSTDIGFSDPYNHYISAVAFPLVYSFHLTFHRNFHLQESWLSNRFVRSFSILLLFVWLGVFSASPFSRFFWLDKVERFHVSRLIPDDSVGTKLDELAKIPSGKVVSVQNNVVDIELFERSKELLDFSEQSLSANPDYVVLDLSTNLFVGDEGCEFLYSKCTDENVVDRFYSLMGLMKSKYSIAFQNDGFMIWRLDYVEEI